ncbi:hypothetical protein C943_02011 [Mariniradius saccharolyticus AK6]|uniref:Uncharacterized protein n=1 Tax=Mariniradius saccharolyticus AK6 TaxID=1239962 RepID=M7X2L8_9BACT|nr:hypothetical protein C943_02011 [Mariniradius saccharolyticus AK6]
MPKGGSNGISNFFRKPIDGTSDANHQAWRGHAIYHDYNFAHGRSPTAVSPNLPRKVICLKEFHFSQFST